MLQAETASYFSFFSSALFFCDARHGFLLCGFPFSFDISLITAFAISAGVRLAVDVFPAFSNHFSTLALSLSFISTFFFKVTAVKTCVRLYPYFDLNLNKT